MTPKPNEENEEKYWTNVKVKNQQQMNLKPQRLEDNLEDNSDTLIEELKRAEDEEETD